MKREPLRLWVVAYDIGDDAVRRQVHDLLSDHGRRVQYSVFECRLGAGGVRALRRRLAELLGPDDGIRWYPLCRGCATTPEQQGNGDGSGGMAYCLP